MQHIVLISRHVIRYFVLISHLFNLRPEIFDKQNKTPVLSFLHTISSAKRLYHF